MYMGWCDFHYIHYFFFIHTYLNFFNVFYILLIGWKSDEKIIKN